MEFISSEKLQIIWHTLSKIVLSGQSEHHIIKIAIAALLIMGCTGKGKDTSNSREPQDSDTLYTWRAAMKVYGYQPKRALQIIDSAVVVGNMSEVWADANRARVYSMTQMNEQMDSLLGGTKGSGLEKGKAIGEQLLKHDSLKTNLKLKQEVPGEEKVLKQNYK